MSSKMSRDFATNSDDERRSSAPSTERNYTYANNAAGHPPPGLSREHNVPTMSSPSIRPMHAHHPLWTYTRDFPRLNTVPMVPFQHQPTSTPHQYHPHSQPYQNQPTSPPSQYHPIISSPSQNNPMSPLTRYYLKSLKPPAGSDFFPYIYHQDSPQNIQDRAQNTHRPCVQYSQSQPPQIPHQTTEPFQFFTSYQGSIPQCAHDTNVAENRSVGENNGTFSNVDTINYGSLPADHNSNRLLRHVPLNVTSYVDQYNRVWTCKSLLKKNCSDKKGRDVEDVDGSSTVTSVRGQGLSRENEARQDVPNHRLSHIFSARKGDERGSISGKTSLRSRFGKMNGGTSKATAKTTRSESEDERKDEFIKLRGDACAYTFPTNERPVVNLFRELREEREANRSVSETTRQEPNVEREDASSTTRKKPRKTGRDKKTSQYPLSSDSENSTKSAARSSTCKKKESRKTLTYKSKEDVWMNKKEHDTAHEGNVQSTSNFFDCLSNDGSSDSTQCNSQVDIRKPLARKKLNTTCAETETSDDTSNESETDLPSLLPATPTVTPSKRRLVLSDNEGTQRRRRCNVPKPRSDRGKVGGTRIVALGGSEEDNTAVADDTIQYRRHRGSTLHRTPAHNERFAAQASRLAQINARNALAATNATQNQNDLNAGVIEIFPATENVNPTQNITNSSEQESAGASPEDGYLLDAPATSSSHSDIPGMWSVIRGRRLEEHNNNINVNANHSGSQRTVRTTNNNCLPDGRTGISVTVAVNHDSTMQNHVPSTSHTGTILLRSISERIYAMGLLHDVGDGALVSNSSTNDSEMMNNYRSINFWDVQRNDASAEQGRNIIDTAKNRRSVFRNHFPAMNSMDRNMVSSAMNRALNILENPQDSGAGPSTTTATRHGNVVLPNSETINEQNGNIAISSGESTNRETVSGGNGNTALPPRSGIFKNTTTLRHAINAFPNNVTTSRRIGNVEMPHYEVQNNVGNDNLAHTLRTETDNGVDSNPEALNRRPSGTIEEAPLPNDHPNAPAEDREITDEEHAAIYNSMVTGTYQHPPTEPEVPLQIRRYTNLFTEEDEYFVEADPNRLALNDPEEAESSASNLFGNNPPAKCELVPNLPLIRGLSRARNFPNTAAAEARNHWQQLEAVTYRRARSYNTVQTPSLERRNPRIAEELQRLQGSEVGLETASTVVGETRESTDEAGPSVIERSGDRGTVDSDGHSIEVQRNADRHGLQGNGNTVDGNVVDLLQGNVSMGCHRDEYRAESQEHSTNSVEVQISTSYPGEVGGNGNGVGFLVDNGNVVSRTGKRVHFQENEKDSDCSGGEQ